MQTQPIRTASRIAYLNATNEPDEHASTAGWTIHGTALGADEVTQGAVDGEPQEVEWPTSVLESAATSLEGQPIIDVHSDSGDGAIEYPPPAEITVGKVDRVGFDADVGVVYQATLADESLAQKIEAGVLTVSPELRFDATERSDGVLEATAAEFAALAVVSVGGSEMASAAAGPNEALAHATLSAAGVEALLSASDAAAASAQASDEPAESGAETSNPNSMGDSDNDPTVAELLERIDEKDERIATLEDDNEALTTENETLSERNATLEDEIDEAKQGYAAVLADDGPFDAEDLVENFDVATLREKVDDRFEDGFAATLSDPDIQSGASGDAGGPDLDPDDEERVATLEDEIEFWSGNEAMTEYVEEKREELAELTGGDV